MITYSVKNISSNSINDVEFYQMLCGYHYGYDGHFSSYSSENYYDPLSQYTPYNSVHQTGNFRYDLTQWGQGDPNNANDHVDFLCFSSSIPPVSYENDMFYGVDGQEPTTGTYSHIKNRSLNGNYYSVFNGSNYINDRVSGAMKWNLGTLAPNETKKITLAVMFGCGPVQHDPPIPDVNASLDITDDVSSCAYPNNDVSYAITYSAYEDVNDVNLTVELSEYVTFNSCTGAGDYNEPNHTVTWNLGDLRVSEFEGFTIPDTNTFTINVTIMPDAPQGNFITNTVRMYSGENLIKTDTVDTNICCDNPVVYVDIDAPTGGNGRTWETAYNNLQTALAAIRNNEHICANQIWVADGNYVPTTNPNDPDATFAMIPGIPMYGHFQGCETSLDQRNLADANYATILNGDVNNDGTVDLYVVLTAANNARLDGFTIRKGGKSKSNNQVAAIFCNNISTTIANCIINENNYYAINCKTPDANCCIAIDNCLIKDNEYMGIFYSRGYDTGKLHLNVNRCSINSNNKTNNGHGIYIESSQNIAEANITNCLISDNPCGDGINFCGSKLTVKNCEISYHNSGSTAIRHVGGNSIFTVEKCVINNNCYGIANVSSARAVIANNEIYNNSYSGIVLSLYANNTAITNNLIYQNGNQMHDGGIVLNRSAEITNNTILENSYYSIKCSGGDPNINSNIIKNNTLDAINNNSLTKVKYNCLPTGIYNNGTNIYSDPCFVSANDYHLKRQSKCINAGNPYFQTSTETDIDGELRCLAPAPVAGGNIIRLDCGADEFNPYDLTLDHITDFLDFAILAKPWKKSNLTTTERYCDFLYDNTINNKDLEIFCQYWLSPQIYSGGPGAHFEINNTDDFAKYDLQKNGIIDFNDFNILAKSWQTAKGNPNFKPRCDFYNDKKIDYKDFLLFSAHWLDLTNDFVPRIPSYIIETNDQTVEPLTLEQLYDLRNWLLDLQSQGEDVTELLEWINAEIALLLPPPPSIWLTCDNNSPDPNTDVTVYIHSEIPLSSMALGIELSPQIYSGGSIIHAMDINDCNQYGWQPDFWTMSEIDPNGLWAYIFDFAGQTLPTDTVGYFTIHYNDGEVDISITQDSSAYDANDQSVPISTDPLILAPQMQMMSYQSLDRQGGVSSVGWASAHAASEPIDANALVNWLDDLWQNDESIKNSMTEQEYLDFRNSIQQSE